MPSFFYRICKTSFETISNSINELFQTQIYITTAVYNVQVVLYFPGCTLRWSSVHHFWHPISPFSSWIMKDLLLVSDYPSLLHNTFSNMLIMIVSCNWAYASGYCHPRGKRFCLVYLSLLFSKGGAHLENLWVKIMIL